RACDSIEEIVLRLRCGTQPGRRVGELEHRTVRIEALQLGEEFLRYKSPELSAGRYSADASRLIAVDGVEHAVVGAVEHHDSDRAAVVDDRRARMDDIAVNRRTNGNAVAGARLVSEVVVATYPADQVVRTE